MKKSTAAKRAYKAVRKNGGSKATAAYKARVAAARAKNRGRK